MSPGQRMRGRPAQSSLGLQIPLPLVRFPLVAIGGGVGMGRWEHPSRPGLGIEQAKPSAYCGNPVTGAHPDGETPLLSATGLWPA